jgi:hypothetical protein
MTFAGLRSPLSVPLEWVVQKVSNYPEGFLIAASVLIAVFALIALAKAF